MSAPSGFLDCFLKFLKGDEGEKLPPPLRGGGRSRGPSIYEIKKAERRSYSNVHNSQVKEGEKSAIISKMIKVEKSEGESEDKEEGSREEGVGEKRKGTDEQISVKRKRGRPSKKTHILCDKPELKNEEIHVKSEKSERLQLEDDLKDEDNCMSSKNKSNTAVGGSEEKISNEHEVCGEVAGSDVAENGKKMNIVTVESEVKEECVSEAKDESVAICESEVKAESNDNAADLEAEVNSEQTSVMSNGAASNCNKKDTKKVDINNFRRKMSKEKKIKQGNSKGETPRRRLSERKAKQKPTISYAESGSDEEMPGFKENSDSDDDPVWVPNDKKNSSDEDSGFSWSKYEKLHLKPKWLSGNCHLPVNPSRTKEDKSKVGAEAKDEKNKSVGDSIKVNLSERKVSLTSREYPVVSLDKGSDISKSTFCARTGVAPSVPAVPQEERSSLLNPVAILMPFQSGTFIAQQKDLEELEEPVIWRVDGKSLLQKYEPFRAENGSIMYRNVSTYSGWGPKSQYEYQQVPVKFIHQTRVETIVQIIQEELVINEEKLIEKLTKDYEKHVYSYEVYLQTLLSQALDNNFIPEIIAEKDEYFLNSVNALDQVCEEKKTKLLKYCEWGVKLKESLITWPTMIVSSSEDNQSKPRCEICCNVNDVTHIKMDGEPYKSSTLDYSPPSDISFKCKDFFVCKKCSEYVFLFHKIAHLKYHTYTEGSRLVSEKKSKDPTKDNTSILHDILADEPTIQKKFHEISYMWAQADVKSRRVKANEDKAPSH